MQMYGVCLEPDGCELKHSRKGEENPFAQTLTTSSQEFNPNLTTASAEFDPNAVVPTYDAQPQRPRSERQ